MSKLLHEKFEEQSQKLHDLFRAHSDSFSQQLSAISARLDGTEQRLANLEAWQQTYSPSVSSHGDGNKRRAVAHPEGLPSPSPFPAFSSSSPSPSTSSFVSPPTQSPLTQEVGADPRKVRISGFQYSVSKKIHNMLFEQLKSSVIPPLMRDSAILQSRCPGRGFGILFKTAEHSKEFLGLMRSLKDPIMFKHASLSIKVYFSPELPPRIGFQRYCLSQLISAIKEKLDGSPAPWNSESNTFTLNFDKFSGRVFLEGEEEKECHDLLVLRISKDLYGTKSLHLVKTAFWQKTCDEALGSTIEKSKLTLLDTLAEQRW